MKRTSRTPRSWKLASREQLRMLLADADQRRLCGLRGGGRAAAPAAPPGRGSQQDGVLVGVRRCAAAEQDQRLGARVPELVPMPGAITTASPARTSPSSPSRMRPAPEVKSRSPPTCGAVLDRLAARRDRRLGQRLVGGVPGRDARELTDGGAVRSHERPAVFQSYAFHGPTRVPAGPRARLPAAQLLHDGAPGHLAVQRAQAAGRVGDAAADGYWAAFRVARGFRTDRVPRVRSSAMTRPRTAWLSECIVAPNGVERKPPAGTREKKGDLGLRRSRAAVGLPATRTRLGREQDGAKIRAGRGHEATQKSTRSSSSPAHLLVAKCRRRSGRGETVPSAARTHKCG